MDVSVSSVVEAARQLPISDQLEIASQLLETVAPEDKLLHLDDPAFIEELDRRSADGDVGVPWEELRDESPSVPEG